MPTLGLETLIANSTSAKGGLTSMNKLYQHNSSITTENQAIASWLVHKAENIPNLNFSISNPANVEQMTYLLVAILNLFFSKVKLPLNLRPFIFALIGANAGCPKGENEWFYLRDYELAIHLMDDEAKTSEALKQRIKRLRKSLIEWQKKNQFKLVIIDRGYVEPEKNKQGEIETNLLGQKIAKGIPTRYKLDVLKVALEILKEHQVNPKSHTELKQMARELQSKLKGFYASPNTGGIEDSDKQWKRTYFFARSNLKKLVGFAKENYADPAETIMSLVQNVMEETECNDVMDLWLKEHNQNTGESIS